MIKKSLTFKELFKIIRTGLLGDYVSVRIFSAAFFIFQPFSLNVLLTLIIPSSRKNLFISPIIIGTAYVEKQTLKLISKLSIAFISPMQPI